MDERECACTYVWGRTHVSSAKSSQSVKPNVCMHCNLWHVIKTFNAATVLFLWGKISNGECRRGRTDRSLLEGCNVIAGIPALTAEPSIVRSQADEYTFVLYRYTESSWSHKGRGRGVEREGNGERHVFLWWMYIEYFTTINPGRFPHPPQLNTLPQAFSCHCCQYGGHTCLPFAYIPYSRHKHVHLQYVHQNGICWFKNIQ